MSLAAFIERWWSRLRGYESARAGAPAARGPTAAAGGRTSRAAPVDEQPDADELKLLDEAKPAKPAGKRKAGAAGFDPYSSDAGHRKPHSWDRVDHD